MKEFVKNWGLFIFFVLLFLSLRLFIVTPVSVKGHSMDPTLDNGQKLITLKMFTVERFDIITTQEPDDLDKLAVKRVIGMPGDTVEMSNDVLTINGEVVEEPYLADYQQKFAEDRLQSEYAYDEGNQATAMLAQTFTEDFYSEVPEGSYFVLGDNRLISKDSRRFGFVEESMIKGKAFLRYWPLNEISLIE
ncbi:signal peptidase I [Enterococcus olivae]